MGTCIESSEVVSTNSSNPPRQPGRAEGDGYSSNPGRKGLSIPKEAKWWRDDWIALALTDAAGDWRGYASQSHPLLLPHHLLQFHS